MGTLWPLLYLLDSLSSQYRAAVVASCLPNLPIAAPPWNATSGTVPGAGGRPGSRVHGAPLGGLVLVSKDPDNIRDIATGMVSFLLFVCVIKLFQIVHYIYCSFYF
jgi:gamma-tubulin complex component 3